MWIERRAKEAAVRTAQFISQISQQPQRQDRLVLAFRDCLSRRKIRVPIKSGEVTITLRRDRILERLPARQGCWLGSRQDVLQRTPATSPKFLSRGFGLQRIIGRRRQDNRLQIRIELPRGLRSFDIHDWPGTRSLRETRRLRNTRKLPGSEFT